MSSAPQSGFGAWALVRRNASPSAALIQVNATERQSVDDRLMDILMILNDPPYGTERCYNGLRLAGALLKNDPEGSVIVFLMADAVLCANKGQKTPEGYYNLERMLRRVTAGRGEVLVCGTCMDARGIAADDVAEGCRRSTMDELAAATLKADKVIVF